MKCSIYEGNYKDQAALIMESKDLLFKFLPDFGGGIASIFSKKLSKEFLVQRPEPKYRKVPFDSSYVEGECSGLDDMFPTIDECFYAKEPWKGIRLADHGEIWNLKAQTQILENEIIFTINGIRLSYIFQKRIRFISDSEMGIEYKVTNNTPFEMDFLWAAHAMLVAQPGVKILVPPENKKAVAVFTNTGRIGSYGTKFDWPEYADGQGIQRKIDIMGKWEDNCEKYYFSEKLKKGWCALQYPDDTFFTFHFPQDKVPYLGILHNTGSFRNIYNVFLEPCTASFDRPDFAAARGQASKVDAFSSYEWFLNIAIGKDINL